MLIRWIADNWIENTAVITGLIYLFLSIKQNIWCWLFGIVSSAVYVVVFFGAKIYADMMVQLYYVIMGFYGWVHWLRVNETKEMKGELPVIRLNSRLTLLLFLISLVLFFVMAWFLKTYTDSPVPWIDSFTTSLSFIATWMLARKIIEHWLIWVIVDAVSVGLYYYRGLYVSIILFVVYTVLAVYGYFEWKKEWKTEQLAKTSS